MTLVIRAGRLVDGSDAAPIRDAVVVVDRDRIVAVGERRRVSIPGGATQIDLPDHTVSSGLIDAHSHVTIETVGTSAERVPESDAELALLGAHFLNKDLRSGVTTMRTLGDRRFIDVVFKKAQAAGLVEIPRLQVAGHLLQPSLVRVPVSEAVADGPDLLLRYLRESIRAGADWVKYYATPTSRSEDPTQAIYSRSEVDLIFDEARRAKRPVAAHCHGGVAADWCIDLGVDSLEHGVYLEEPQFRAMGQKGIVLVPTTGVVLEQPSAGASARLLESQARARTFLREARKHGVRCIPGSDAVHGNMAFELSIMISCGWSPHEALLAATRDAARLLRLGAHTGTVEAGKWADLVAFRGDPLDDPAAFRTVDFVMQAGRIVHDPLGAVWRAGMAGRGNGTAQSGASH
jgi:imidazolonepropionase-like amidohydrolase